MSHNHLFGALSSLLILIFAATSEVNTFDYYHQNSCNVEKSDSIFKNYSLTSDVYNCVVNENSIKDFGCKDDVEKACTDISPGDYDKRLTFVKDENDTFIDGDITCKKNYCNDHIRMNPERLKKHFKSSLRLGIRNVVIAEMVKLLFLFKLIAVQFFMEMVSILYDWITVQF